MIKAIYIKKSTLEFKDLFQSLGLKKDNGGRWYASSESPEFVQEYCAQYRTPSRAFPHSHSKALLSQKFAKFLCEQDPELAIKLNVAERAE